MNPARSPTAAQSSKEEATRTGSGRGRRIFAKRSPGPHRKGRVTWDLSAALPGFLTPVGFGEAPLKCELGGKSALSAAPAQLLPAGIRAQGARAAAAGLRSSWGRQVSPCPHPAGARVLRNKVTGKTAETHDWVQACRWGDRSLMRPQLRVVRFVFNTCTF